MSNKIKVRELQVNDWIDIPEDDNEADYYKVSEILGYSMDAIRHGDNALRVEDFQDWWYAKDIRPIPITEDFLLANGFIKSAPYTDGLTSYTKTTDQDYGSYVTVWYSNGHFLMTNIIFHKSTPYPHDGKLYDAFQYVHELQHALRSCGMSEMADNFKIK